MLPAPGHPPEVFARLTGIPLRRLRHYARTGALPADWVDPDTGHRRYAPTQVPRGRLFHALTATGMDVAAAAAAVRERDRTAVLAHLDHVAAMLELGRETVPPPRHDDVHVVTWYQEECIAPAALGPVALGPRLVEEVCAVQRELARAVAVEVSGLPVSPRASAVPSGPLLPLEPHTAGTGRPATGVLLPWSGDDPPDGWRWEGWGSLHAWAVRDVGPADELEDELVAQADAAVADFLATDERGGLRRRLRCLVLDPPLARVSLAVEFASLEPSW